MNKALVIGGGAATLLVLGLWMLGSQTGAYECTIDGDIVHQDAPCPAPVTRAPTTGDALAPPPAPSAEDKDALATAFYDPDAPPPMYRKATPADFVTASPQSMFARLQQACAARNQVDFFRNYSNRYRKAYSEYTAPKRTERFEAACAELATPLLLSYAAGPDFSIVPNSQSELCSLPTKTSACVSGWRVVIEQGQLKLDQF